MITGRTDMIDSVESTVPTAFETRTQYVAESVKVGVVKLDALVPTGVVVTPTAP